MSKRNFILLIIILAIVVAGLFGFLYWQAKTTMPGEEGAGTNFISRFNPFSSNNTSTPGDETSGTDIPNNEPGTQGEISTGKLKKVSSMPVAGFTVFMKERLKEVPVVPVTEESATPPKIAAKPTPPATEFAPALRYVERATGNIYQTFVDKIEERRFSGTIIPKIYEAYFGSGGNTVVMRHLKGDEKTIETFVGTLPKEKIGEDIESNEIKGSFLVDNIKDTSLSPDTSKIFYLFESGSGMIGTTFNLSDGKKTQVFDSLFTEWLPGWPNSKTVTLTTKASGTVPGYMYTLNLDNKTLTKVLSDIRGLTTLMSPSGKLVLYGDSTLGLYIYHTDTKNSEQLGVRTLPEKCVWSKISDAVYCSVPGAIAGATYPDSWYRGEVSFSDQIWKINIQNGNASIISDPFDIGEDIDGIKLGLDRDENYLFFVNKKDSFLWKLGLK